MIQKKKLDIEKDFKKKVDAFDKITFKEENKPFFKFPIIKKTKKIKKEEKLDENEEKILERVKKSFCLY